MTIINTLRTGPEAEPMLEYKLHTTPYPIRVSPEGAEEGDGSELDPARAQLVFVASNTTGYTVQLRKLTVEIPTGKMADQLALSLERVEPSISLQGWSAGRGDESIVFTTDESYTEIAPGGGFTFQIDNVPVNHEVGAVELSITERYSGSGSATLGIITGKFPQDFYLDDFSADTYEIENGGSVKLTWKRSEGVQTDLIYGGRCEDVTQDEKKTIENIKQTTTFYLIGKVRDVQLMRSVPVTVLKPDMVVNKLTVKGAFEAEGGATVHDELMVVHGNPDIARFRILHATTDEVIVRSKLRLAGDSDFPGSGSLEVRSSATVAGKHVLCEGD